jgi:hypothetical protein
MTFLDVEVCLGPSTRESKSIDSMQIIRDAMEVDKINGPIIAGERTDRFDYVVRGLGGYDARVLMRNINEQPGYFAKVGRS